MQTTTITKPFRISIILDDPLVAQVERIKQVIADDGEILSASMLPAEPLAMPLSAEILGEITAGLLARIATLEADAATLDAVRAELAASQATLAEHQAISDQLVTAARAAIAANDLEALAEILHQAGLYGSAREADRIDFKTAALQSEIDALAAAKAALSSLLAV